MRCFGHEGTHKYTLERLCLWAGLGVSCCRWGERGLDVSVMTAMFKFCEKNNMNKISECTFTKSVFF